MIPLSTGADKSVVLFFFFFSSRRRHTRCSRDWSSDVCSSDLAGCLAFAAFVAGAVVVSWTLFSGPPRLDAVAPVPDSVATALRRRAALAPSDTVQLAFTPDGPQDSILLVVGQRRVVVAAPRRTRSYRRGNRPLPVFPG